MSFTDRQKINMFTKALIAGVIDSESMSAWYESFFPFTFIMDSLQVWLQIDLLKQYPASTIAQARGNASGDLSGVIQDLSQTPTRLTLMVGSNGTTWVAHSIHNDRSSSILQNWLLPQLIPQSNGMPSNGYGILLYNGDPNNGGVLISTTTGATGSGETASQAWVFNYANGLLFLSPGFTDTVDDPYLLGFRYIGKTVADNTTALNQLQTTVQTNTDSLATNTTDISTNASNISSITTDVSTLDSKVDILDSRVDDVETGIGKRGLKARFVK